MRDWIRRQFVFTKLTIILLFVFFSITGAISYQKNINTFDVCISSWIISYRTFLCEEYGKLTPDRVTHEKIVKAASHKNTKPQLKALFEKDKTQDYTELGGYLTLTQEGFLKFYEYPSQHAWVIPKLEKLKQWQDAYQFFKQNRDKLETDIDKDWGTQIVSSTIKMFEFDKFTDKQRRWDDSLRFLRALLDDHFKMHKNIKYWFFAEKLWSDKFIGSFHLHPNDKSGPSKIDKIGSQNLREFMFEPTEDGYRMWDMQDVPADKPNSKLLRYRYKWKEK